MNLAIENAKQSKTKQEGMLFVVGSVYSSFLLIFTVLGLLLGSPLCPQVVGRGRYPIWSGEMALGSCSKEQSKVCPSS